MDLSGLQNRIYRAAFRIDSGRKGFASIGRERKGRIAYLTTAQNSYAKKQKIALDAYVLL